MEQQAQTLLNRLGVKFPQPSTSTPIGDASASAQLEVLWWWQNRLVGRGRRVWSVNSQAALCELTPLAGSDRHRALEPSRQEDLGPGWGAAWGWAPRSRSPPGRGLFRRSSQKTILQSNSAPFELSS